MFNRNKSRLTSVDSPNPSQAGLLGSEVHRPHCSQWDLLPGKVCVVLLQGDMAVNNVLSIKTDQK